MKWKKLGKIFDPTEHQMPLGCQSHGQSPQAIVFDDYVRIYFSTRAKEEKTGKFISHIAFVDMTLDLKKIINISKNEVIPMGELGTFDEHGIFPISPVSVNGRLLAYTTGWSRRVSVSVETSIGLAVSEDGGLTFKKMGMGPVLSSSLHEPFLVGDAFVKVYNNEWHMWYMYGTRWEMFPGSDFPDRVYKVGHATSKDGSNWKIEGKQIVPDVIDRNECQALPTVFHYKNRYHMYFCFRHASGFRTDPDKGYRLGYAYSEDLVNWTRDDKNSGIGVSGEGWDSQMMCYPNVFECQGKFYLLYNGNEFGRQGFGVAVLDD